MSNFITDLSIYNFKSIKELHLKPKRVNVFIGRPNVGKSNVLEALSLFSLPYLKFNPDLSASDLIRMDKTSDLFFFNDFNNSIIIETNLGNAYLACEDFKGKNFSFYTTNREEKYNIDKHNLSSYTANRRLSNMFKSLNKNDYGHTPFDDPSVLPSHSSIDQHGKISFNFPEDYYPPFLTYHYSRQLLRNPLSPPVSSLLPPFGQNLFDLLSLKYDLAEKIGKLFMDYGYELMYHNEERRFWIQRRSGHIIYTIPFVSIADTLLRYIFHYMAIHTSDNSILLLEEPESHSYPPYIIMLANEIIGDEKNQYFIATHSSYLLDILLENDKNSDVAVFVVSYKDYQTKVRELTIEEIAENINSGADLFMSLPQYE